MLGFQGPARAQRPTLGDAINAGFGYLEVKCLRFNTHQTVALDIVRCSPPCAISTASPPTKRHRALFRVVNRYVGNLAAYAGRLPRLSGASGAQLGRRREMAMMRWGMPPPPRTGGPPVTNIRNTSSSHWRGWLKPDNRCLVPANSFAEYAPEPNPVTKNEL